ncbi:MAG: family 43 glycosylhydrolase [Mangrovibacterium sp.]
MEHCRYHFHSWPVPEDYVIECICTESPKLIYHNNYYYLTLAQGGTAGPSTSHMATSLRAKNVDGPWEYSPYTPVIRTTDKRERWWSTGHATLFEGADDQWYMVFHAYENSFRTLGRQVLITPVEWTDDGWFHEGSQAMFQDVKGKSFTDEFDSGKLDLHWAFIDETDFRRITLGDGKLTMKASGDSPVTSNPLVITAENHSYSITAKVNAKEGVNAGLVLYYDSLAQWGLSLSAEGISQIVEGACYPPFKPDSVSSTVFLRLVNDRNEISYYYSQDGNKWRKLEYSHDVSGFHTNTRGGFKSIRPGLIAVGLGIAEFEFFRYDDIP